MIPLRDSIKARRFPVVTVALILVNLVAFVRQFTLGPSEMEGLVIEWAVVPARLLAALGTGEDSPRQVATVFSSMFLHGDLLHVLGNMWFLWIFGDNVEDRFGRAGFFVFYLVAGVAAAMCQVLVSPQSAVPMIGASGAIAGVLGAYARFYPHARVLTLIPIFVFFQFIEIPALFFLGFWFLVQIWSSVAGAAGVAWWAHMAGFVAGVVLSFLARRGPSTERRPRPTRGRVIRLRR